MNRIQQIKQKIKKKTENTKNKEHNKSKQSSFRKHFLLYLTCKKPAGVVVEQKNQNKELIDTKPQETFHVSFVSSLV